MLQTKKYLEFIFQLIKICPPFKRGYFMSAAQVSGSSAEFPIKDPYDDITICIDGGGSKTVLQIIDADGRVLSLFKDNIATEESRAGGSNINTVGPDGIKSAL